MGWYSTEDPDAGADTTGTLPVVSGRFCKRYGQKEVTLETCESYKAGWKRESAYV